MDEFLDSVLIILDHLVTPQETIYYYFSTQFPIAIDYVLPAILATAAFAACIGFVLTLLRLNLHPSISLDIMETIVFFLMSVLVLTFGGFILARLAANDDSVRSLSLCLLGIGFLIEKACIAYGALRVGKWGGENILLLLLAAVVAILAAYFINRAGVTLLVSMALVALCAIEVRAGLGWSADSFNPLLAIGTLVLISLGGVFEPEMMGWYIQSLDFKDLSTRGAYYLVGCWTFLKYLFPLSFIFGILRGLLSRIAPTLFDDSR